jgi:hypothetical protein
VSSPVKYIIRLIVLLAVQIYVLDKIPHLHRFITPYLYYVFILWLPFSISRQWLLIFGFLTGLIYDYFTMTPGLHAAACTLVAYVRPFLISVLTPRESSEFNYREPSPRAMQWTPYAIYVLVLTLFHHGYLVLLEWLSFGSFLDFIIKVIASTGISLLLVFTVELIFPRKLKFRTNTA